MKEKKVKIIILEVILHLICAGMFFLVADYLFHTYLQVDFLNEQKVYFIDPFQKSVKDFEDTETFNDILEHETSDLLQYIGISMDMESGGTFYPQKHIDVVEYSSRGLSDRVCDATAVYELDDLIKWGKEDFHFRNRIMSLGEFVTYYGNCIYPENFRLNEDGQLYFDGYHVDHETTYDILTQRDYENLRKGMVDGKGEGKLDLKPDAKNDLENSLTVRLENDKYVVFQSEADKDLYYPIFNAINEKTTEELYELVFSYLMRYISEYVEIYREDDNMTTLSFSQLECTYKTVDGKQTLYSQVNNWIDFFVLQNAIEQTAHDFAYRYDTYKKGANRYAQNNSNLRYVIRLRYPEGTKTKTITNLPDYASSLDDSLTEIFSENLRYIIYYAGNLEYSTLTSVEEQTLQDILRDSSYNYPDDTKIWIYSDIDYTSSEDALFDAHFLFLRNKESVGKKLLLFLLLLFIWLIIFVYCCYLVGIVAENKISKEQTLSWFDRIWSEVIFILILLMIFIDSKGFSLLRDVTGSVYNSHLMIGGLNSDRILNYLYFGLFGFFFSFGIMFFATIYTRRIKYGNLISDSLSYYVINAGHYVIKLISRHRSLAINTLLPYNFFLLGNLFGMFVLGKYIESKPLVSFITGALVVSLDALIGVYLFRGGAEKREIVDGITRIRDGETDYKLETQNLTGTNQDLADAVNNIGEGIRKAVQTSMRDEQMKSDLITNVSHDLKTPLTSIINYVDLLKRQGINEEPASDYIRILDDKSKRLKQLLDDLLEASKISSGNIELKMSQINLTELMKQTAGEFEDKFSAKKLAIVFEHQENCYILADGRRLWRIVDNLFNNVCKYALDGTRVYIDLMVSEGKCFLSIKNISAQPTTVQGEELTERFIRGDSSRTTEGSGLGLFIAKSLTEAQKGKLNVSVDGDLFKVCLEFPEYTC